jgi:hypothetical protein
VQDVDHLAIQDLFDVVDGDLEAGEVSDEVFGVLEEGQDAIDH